MRPIHHQLSWQRFLLPFGRFDATVVSFELIKNIETRHAFRNLAARPSAKQSGCCQVFSADPVYGWYESRELFKNHIVNRMI